MTSLTSALTGSQRPRVSSVPVGDEAAGVEAVELAESVGLVLDDWQRFALSSFLRERPGPRWAAFECGLVVPRQNGKGAILEARELAGLFLFGERLILHSAHEFKTAQEAFARVLALVENTDDLRKRVARIRTSHGEEGIELLTGQRLRFVARSTGSGRGFSADCVILDEAMVLPESSMGALLPTLSARPNPQIWYTSSAGRGDSDVLRSVRDRAVKGESGGLAYLEWSADPKDSADDEGAWASANPALGIRIGRDHVAREFDAMPPAEFARERLGIWDVPAGADVVIDLDAWRACLDSGSSVVDPVAFGVDVSPDGSASISVAGSRPDGLVHVEVVDHRSGTSWVTGRLQELVRRWSPSCIVLDAASPVGALLPDLDRVGLSVSSVAGREAAQAAVAFTALVSQRQVRHLEQADLNAAVAAAKRRMVGDLWAFGRRGSSVDISPLVSCALASWGHAQNAGRVPSIIDPWSMDDDGEVVDLP